MYHYLDNFKKNLDRYAKYGVSYFECEKAIKETCEFFNIPVPVFIGDLTGHPRGQTMFFNAHSNKLSYADDIICYNMEELKYLGVNSKDAFSLVMTHECAHRLLQSSHLPGRNNGQWEQELCCDFFMGVRCGLDKISHDALVSVRNGLSQSPGSVSHPTGKLRYDVISYGVTYVEYMDLIHHQRHSIPEYMRKFEEWRQKHAEEIYQAQIPFYG